MKKWLKVLVLLVLALPAYAQRDKINDYFRQLKTARHDSDRVNIYYEIAQLYWYINPDSALLVGRKGVELSKKINYPTGLSRCYFTIGSVYYYQRNFPHALHYYLRTLKLGEEMGAERTIGSSLYNIGLVYTDLGNYDKAKEYFLSTLDRAEKNEDKELYAASLGYLGEIFYLQKQYELALEYKTRSLVINREIEFIDGIGGDLNSLGSIYLKMGKLEKSLTYTLESIRVFQKKQNTDGIASGYNNLAEVYHERKQFAESDRYAQMSLQLSRVLGDKKRMSDSYQILYQNSVAQKNFGQALHYRNVQIGLQDSIFSLEKEKAVSQLQSTYDLEKKQHQITLLEKNKLIQEKELSRQRGQIHTFIAGGGVLFVVAFLLMMNNREKRIINELLQLQNRAISEQQDEILRQNMRLEGLNTVKDRLLSIISHDFRSPLHSLQGLVSLMKEGELSSQEIRHMSELVSEKLDVTLHLVENLLQWAKSQMEGMRVKSEIVDLTCLITDTVQLLKEPAERKGIVLKNETTEPVWAYADKALVDIVIRNLVANAIKFSRARDTVSVSATADQQWIYLCVRDTGMGISLENQAKIFNSVSSFTTVGTASEKGTGLGLALCKELVEKNGGKIWFESQPGQGSTFTFTIPAESKGEKGQRPGKFDSGDGRQIDEKMEIV
jgi:two-component system, sensor histidine kinase and response regulator